MPLIYLPADDVLKALGKMTLWFSELEFYVNDCLLWLFQPQTEADSKKITNREFNRRAGELKDILQTRSDASTLWRDPTMRPPIDFNPALTDLSDQRNLLAHGMAYNALEKQDGQLVGRIYKYSSRSKQTKALDDAELIENLTAKIERAAEQAKSIAISLQLEHQHHQGKP